MIIKKIYGLERCPACELAKKQFPEAKYIILNKLDNKQRNDLFIRFKENNLISAPVLEDENGNLFSIDK